MRALVLLLLVAQDAPLWERQFTDANDAIRRVSITGGVGVAHFRARVESFDLATGKTLASLNIPAQANVIEFAGSSVLIQTMLYDLKTGRVLATDPIEGGGRASGSAFYGWTGDKLVKVASAGQTEWSFAVKDLKGTIVPAADGGVVIRVPHPKGGAEGARAYVKVSPAGKIEWTAPIADADIAGMEQIRGWSVWDDGKELQLLCGKVKGTGHALWIAVVDGKVKRVLVKDPTLLTPRLTPQTQVPHVLRRDGEWYAVGNCTVDTEIDKRETKTGGVIVVNLSDGNEVRRVPAGLIAEAPPGITVLAENELFDVVANKSIGKLGAPGTTISFSKSFAFVKEGPKLRWVKLAGGGTKEIDLQASLARAVDDLVAMQTREGQKTVVGCFDLEKGVALRGSAYEGNVQSWVDAVGENLVLHGAMAGRARVLVAGKRSP